MSKEFSPLPEDAEQAGVVRSDARGLLATEDAQEQVVGRYFIYMYPPLNFWKESPAKQAHEILQSSPNPETPLILYVHLPFCYKRCDFCYYAVSTNGSDSNVDRYLESLFREIDIYSNLPFVKGRKPKAIYFGGGTPSQLSVPQMEKLFAHLRRAFPWDEAEEITFECAPKTVTREKIEAMYKAGVTRITLGVQQFDEDVLRGIGRVHKKTDAITAIKTIQEFPFQQINVDLMVGLVGQTEESFLSSIATLETEGLSGVTSVTLYPLQVLIHAPMYKTVVHDKLSAPLAQWSEKMRRLQIGFDALKNMGFQRCSAYSAAKDLNKHYLRYLNYQYHGADLLGLGNSSLSYLGGVHYQNITSWETGYEKSLRSGELPIVRAYVLSNEEQFRREFILQMRLGGVLVSYLKDKYGIDPTVFFAKQLEALVNEDWIRVTSDEIKPTVKGLSRVDRYLPAFYASAHMDAMAHKF